MDVKIGRGAFAANAGGTPRHTQKQDAAAPFSALLRSAGARTEDAAAREGFSAQTPEEVFARALADRSAPDLDRLDDYLEWLIGQEREPDAGGPKNTTR